MTPKQLATAKQEAINNAKVIIQTSDGLTGGSSTPATSFTLGLSDSGVAADTYNSVTVDAKGRVTKGEKKVMLKPVHWMLINQNKITR